MLLYYCKHFCYSFIFIIIDSSVPSKNLCLLCYLFINILTSWCAQAKLRYYMIEFKRKWAHYLHKSLSLQQKNRHMQSNCAILWAANCIINVPYNLVLSLTGSHSATNERLAISFLHGHYQYSYMVLLASHQGVVCLN